MEKKECPTNCPFLGFRSFLPEVMPFFCEKYNVYLGMTPAKKVVKCFLCLGENSCIQQQGLELLETMPVCVSQLKKAFLEMRPSDQQKVVDVLMQMGVTIRWNVQKPVTAVFLLTEVMRLAYEKKKREQSPEVQEFLKLLDIITAGEGSASPATKTLLSNLFQVLDNSEKGMLLSLLENPVRAKTFLDVFSKIPHDQNMLKNFRLLLYDFDKQNEKGDKGNKMLVVEKGKAMNMAQHLQLQHIMQQMIRVRTKTRMRS